MGSKLTEEKVFKDPVHHYIYVQDALIWKLINTKEFQRLRRIRQLGTSYLTFHGAEHSRFSHSLGVYEVARRIISQFERSDYSEDDWPREERLLTLCAALLHDVGHGPFSHSIEKAFGTHHEEWTCRIVLGDTEINRVLREEDPRLPGKVASVIRKTYPREIVVSLISSQMDVDRMDYLLRDAYFTGVNYGTFDIERILRLVRPYRGHLVVKDSGMHAVEDYLMARYQMYWQVYFHPVTRSAEILLHKIFHRAKILMEEGYRFAFLPLPLQLLLLGMPDLESYLKLDEALIQTAFLQWTEEEDAVLADLCGRFVHRRLLKDVPLAQVDGPLLDQVSRRLTAGGFDPLYYMELDFPVDMPYDVYRAGEQEEKLPILLYDGREQVTEISRRSEIVRSISGIRLGQNRLYIPEEVLYMDDLPEMLGAYRKVR